MTEKEQKNYDKLFKSLIEMNDVNTRLDLLGQAVSPMTREIIFSINKSVYDSAVLIRDFVPHYISVCATLQEMKDMHTMMMDFIIEKGLQVELLKFREKYV